MPKLSKQIIVSTSTHGLLTLKYSSKYPTTHAPPSISLGKLFWNENIKQQFVSIRVRFISKIESFDKIDKFLCFFFMRVVTSAYLSQFTKV